MQNKTEHSYKAKLNALCCSADSEGIKKFLANEPSIDLNYDQGAPLIFAIRSIQVYPAPAKGKCLATLQTLVEAGANVHINGEAPLEWAMRIDNHTAVDYFMSLDTTYSLPPDDVQAYRDRNPKLDPTLISRLESAAEVHSDDQPTPFRIGMK